MTKSSDLPGLKSSLSRRTMLTGMAAGAAALAMPAIWPSRAFAATPGSNPGKYKIDLGGYNGPELTSAPITLKIMRQEFPPEVNEVMNAQYAAFSAAYPNITIQEERVPYGDLPTKVQVYVASGQAPDIMMGRNDFASAYAAGELTLPLQQFLSPDFIGDVYAPLRESATINGNLVCLPWETNPVYMAFNRDIFDKLGIAPPPEVAEYDGGWTVEEYLQCFDDVTKALRAAGDQQTFALAASGYGNGGPGSNYTQLESIWVRMMGDPNAAKDSSLYNTFMGVSEDGFTASGYVNTAEAAAGLANYKTVFANGYTPTGVVPDQFRGGAAAITFSGTGTVKRFLKTGQPFNFGMSPAPKGAIAYTTTVADSPVIFSGTPYPAETAALLAFLCNDENRFAFHDAWGSMPVRKTLVDALPEYASDQRLQLGTNVADHAFGPPKSVGWFDYFSAINPAVKDIALGADPQARLNDVATQIDGLLSKYK